jgi:hypothetical protein
MIKQWKKVFKSKEKAEEYVTMNRPCLSVSDILKMREDFSGHLWYHQFVPHLKQLAKEKIK